MMKTEAKLPSPTELKTKLDLLSTTVDQVNMRARILAERFKLHGPKFYVDGPPKYISEAILIGRRWFQVSRAGEKWSVFYGKDMTLAESVRNLMKGVPQPVTDVRWDIKCLFLSHSQKFFESYLAHVRDTFSGIGEDLDAARRLIEELNGLFPGEKDA